jgi:hypothetical protein
MLLLVIGGGILVLNVWLVLEGVNALRQSRKPSELLDLNND